LQRSATVGSIRSPVRAGLAIAGAHKPIAQPLGGICGRPPLPVSVSRARSAGPSTGAYGGGCCHDPSVVDGRVPAMWGDLTRFRVEDRPQEESRWAARTRAERDQCRPDDVRRTRRALRFARELRVQTISRSSLPWAFTRDGQRAPGRGGRAHVCAERVLGDRPVLVLKLTASMDAIRPPTADAASSFPASARRPARLSGRAGGLKSMCPCNPAAIPTELHRRAPDPAQRRTPQGQLPALGSPRGQLPEECCAAEPPHQ
jgi:hypothetical protein